MSYPFAPGDRVLVSPAHEDAPGWYALVLAPARMGDPRLGERQHPLVSILPEDGSEPPRDVRASVLSLVRRADEKAGVNNPLYG